MVNQLRKHFVLFSRVNILILNVCKDAQNEKDAGPKEEENEKIEVPKVAVKVHLKDRITAVMLLRKKCLSSCEK